jgi:hypothetical protein
MIPAADLSRELAGLGVELLAEDSILGYSAPPGVVKPVLFDVKEQQGANPVDATYWDRSHARR